jgi:hypothetical protein
MDRWGFFKNLSFMTSERFPDVDQRLFQAMGTETRMFLESQVREDRNALELWTANYTFLNEQLARHYGIPNVSGSDFRRVTLPDNRRAGLLGQGSLLSITWVMPTRTSPTKRGVYLLEQFFGMSAPEPPATVPPMADAAEDRGRSMRSRVADHKVNPSCVNCHTNMDPLGLALENFDQLGRWRTTDGGAAIDASGVLWDGSSFNGPAELGAVLMKFRDAYYSSMTERLFAYAVGRRTQGARVYEHEMPSVRAIVREASSDGYRWSSIVLGIVKSTSFQLKTLVP